MLKTIGDMALGVALIAIGVIFGAAGIDTARGGVRRTATDTGSDREAA